MAPNVLALTKAGERGGGRVHEEVVGRAGKARLGVGFGWPAGRCRRRRRGGEAEVREDGGDDGSVGEVGEDADGTGTALAAPNLELVNATEVSAQGRRRGRVAAGAGAGAKASRSISGAPAGGGADRASGVRESGRSGSWGNPGAGGRVCAPVSAARPDALAARDTCAGHAGRTAFARPPGTRKIPTASRIVAST